MILSPSADVAESAVFKSAVDLCDVICRGCFIRNVQMSKGVFGGLGGFCNRSRAQTRPLVRLVSIPWTTQTFPVCVCAPLCLYAVSHGGDMSGVPDESSQVIDVDHGNSEEQNSDGVPSPSSATSPSTDDLIGRLKSFEGSTLHSPDVPLCLCQLLVFSEMQLRPAS